MYLIASQPEKALALLAEHGPVSKLIEVWTLNFSVHLLVGHYITVSSMSHFV
jgi:hypothetical protein